MAILRILLTAIVLAVSVNSSAQKRDFEPLTSWPYLYEDFQNASIKTFSGSTIEYDKLNINVINGRAHYVQDGIIMEAEITQVESLSIAENLYVNVSGKMCKVLKESDHSYVVSSVEIDTEAMNKSDIGYGKSSLASTQNVSLNAITNNMEIAVNKSLDIIVGGKDSGEPLLLKKVNGIVYNGVFIPATRSEILNISGIDKDAVKDFIKNRKIKFSKLDDLAVLLDYLYTL